MSKFFTKKPVNEVESYFYNLLKWIAYCIKVDESIRHVLDKMVMRYIVIDDPIKASHTELIKILDAAEYLIKFDYLKHDQELIKDEVSQDEESQDEENGIDKSLKKFDFDLFQKDIQGQDSKSSSSSE